MSVEISGPPESGKTVLASNVILSDKPVCDAADITIPGALVSSAQGYMRGHGTFAVEDKLYSSAAGTVEQVNKLVRVRPVKQRYQGEIGDVVVGRIVEVQQKRWKVEANSRLHSVLLLGSVNLPGGELRRKSIEDELAMREYLREGDLVSAEVQQCFQDGSLSLHTRSLKYGKLGQGVLLKVLPHLIRRRKSHFCNLPCGASVILGCNGYVWVSRLIDEKEGGGTGGYIEDLEQVSPETRNAIARVSNCIRLLARNSVPLFDTTIIHAYNAAQQVPTKDLIKPEVADDIAAEVIAQCRMEEMES
ncbi:KH domain-containing protein [Ditylenchus destructor]|nr:KH domain-containing protein [Ditylenchus destructor]